MEPHEGTPQGGPLSPLLANVLLDEVDKELEKRAGTHSCATPTTATYTCGRGERASEC
jgi:retron-type reverse transcriptase